MGWGRQLGVEEPGGRATGVVSQRKDVVSKDVDKGLQPRLPSAMFQRTASQKPHEGHTSALGMCRLSQQGSVSHINGGTIPRRSHTMVEPPWNPRCP